MPDKFALPLEIDNALRWFEAALERATERFGAGEWINYRGGDLALHTMQSPLVESDAIALEVYGEFYLVTPTGPETERCANLMSFVISPAIDDKGMTEVQVTGECLDTEVPVKQVYVAILHMVGALWPKTGLAGKKLSVGSPQPHYTKAARRSFVEGWHSVKEANTTTRGEYAADSNLSEPALAKYMGQYNRGELK
jgi:hypothetical protein